MLNKSMKFILILLFVFTPIAFGSMEIWAFSLMELGILLLIILWSVQNLMRNADCGLWSSNSKGMAQLVSLRREYLHYPGWKGDHLKKNQSQKK